MTAKRFTIIYGDDENPFEWDILDNEKDALVCQCNGKPICDLLNELHEENTMLKERRHEDINELSVIAMRFKALEKENEELKKFKSKFYDMIDKRIGVLEHDYNQAVKNGMPSSSVYSEIELLEELKEEMDHI